MSEEAEIRKNLNCNAILHKEDIKIRDERKKIRQ